MGREGETAMMDGSDTQGAGSEARGATTVPGGTRDATSEGREGAGVVLPFPVRGRGTGKITFEGSAFDLGLASVVERE